MKNHPSLNPNWTSSTSIENNEDIPDDKSIMIYLNMVNSTKSKQAYSGQENDGEILMDGYETDKSNGWVDIGLGIGKENIISSSESEDNEYEDSWASPNIEYRDSQTTKIIKSFCQIDSKGRLSLTSLLESGNKRQIYASVSPQHLQVPSIVYHNGDDNEYKHNVENNQDYENLYDYASTDIFTKLIVNGYLRSFKPELVMIDIVNLTTTYLCDNEIMFDQRKIMKDKFGKDRVLILSDHGFKYGIHEWNIKITKCDIYLQEIGVIGTNYLDDVEVLEDGIKGSDILGARAIYGNELIPRRNYYASYNDNGNTRCDKDLTQMVIHKNGWKVGDVIKVELNLRKGYVRFYLNHKKVRKVISLQNNKTWYPVISWSGNCQYELIHFG